MRKIKSEADIERARKRNNIILGLSMIFLMVASTAGFAIMSADNENSNSVSEGGFNFLRDGGMWKLAFGEGEVFSFQNLPSELNDVMVDINITFGEYANSPLYFVNQGEGTNEILMNLGNYILRYQEACLGEKIEIENQTLVIPADECEGDLPVKDCGNNIIVFKEGNETKVYGDENCVFIEGDVIRGGDAFLYRLIGVN